MSGEGEADKKFGPSRGRVTERGLRNCRGFVFKKCLGSGALPTYCDGAALSGSAFSCSGSRGSSRSAGGQGAAASGNALRSAPFSLSPARHPAEPDPEPPDWHGRSRAGIRPGRCAVGSRHCRPVRSLVSSNQREDCGGGERKITLHTNRAGRITVTL